MYATHWQTTIVLVAAHEEALFSFCLRRSALDAIWFVYVFRMVPPASRWMAVVDECEYTNEEFNSINRITLHIIRRSIHSVLTGHGKGIRESPSITPTAESKPSSIV